MNNSVNSNRSSFVNSFRASNASVNEVEKTLKDFQEAVKNNSINLGNSDNDSIDDIEPIPNLNKNKIT